MDVPTPIVSTQPKAVVVAATLSQNQDEIEALFLGSKSIEEGLLGGSLSPQDFLREVLSQMPHREVATRPAQATATLTETLWRRLTEYLESEFDSIPYIIYVEETNIVGKDPSSPTTNIAITIVQKDRPFIVSTIAETLNNLELPIRLLLHPIFAFRPSQISLLYVEIEIDQSGISREQLELELNESLLCLFKTTEDFSPMLFRLDRAASLCERSPYSPSRVADSALERGQLIRWLLDESFIFLGLCSWDINKNDATQLTPRTPLGLLKEPFDSQLMEELKRDVVHVSSANLESSITKLSYRSKVVRSQYLTHFVLSIPNDSAISPNIGGATTLFSICGLFSSKVSRDECRDVPMLRVKLRELIEEEGLYDNSYDYTYVVESLNRMPKDFALRLPTAILKEMVGSGDKIYDDNSLNLTTYLEPNGSGVSVSLLLSRDKFNREYRDSVQSILEHAYQVTPGSSEFNLDFGSHPQSRLYFFLPAPLPSDNTKNDKVGLQQVSTNELYLEIQRVTQSWEDKFSQLIAATPAIKIAKEWRNPTFSMDYRSTFSPSDALGLITRAAKLTQEQWVDAYFCEGESLALVVLALGKEVPLSSSIPIVEHIGFEVLSSSTNAVERSRSTTLYVHRLLITPKQIELQSSLPYVTADLNLDRITSGIREVFLKRAENDLLNGLLLTTELGTEAIQVLRGYCSLLWQVNKVASRQVLGEALVFQPAIAQYFWEYLTTKFNPLQQLTLEARTTLTTGIEQSVYELLTQVKDITQDRVLRSLMSLIKATVRVNFFTDRHKLSTPIPRAMKIHSEDLEILPLPRPKFEIFVFGADVEGVHLRAGNVARGGLRWSERQEDFRTEVLGLMKTQKVKNVLIVPTGAKGGFIVRHLPTEGSKVHAAVEAAYSSFIRALLSLTDNRVGDAVTHPPDVLCYDASDPYFVVAADKGTATFSDVANRIAETEFNFWLGDAFASGGSNGYDHKKYGITARGAWECVKRHFHDLGIRYDKESFSVVGIGDMSGDVFGNGLLQSDKAKLISAFNHRHIFIDPNPEPESSFAERSRLFALPRSQWTDYDPKLISEGGGVFNKNDKAIPLHKNVRHVLGVPASTPSTVNGEELIKLILKAPCDLLWNGGIGTYVKSSNEAHSAVNDGVNDRVRVDATDIRARVIGEGGNLGLTQRSRIECAERGVRLNTDAIDNSAGVALSDKEVNLKILFDKLVASGKLTKERRNELLFAIDHDVAQQVLDVNHNHATLLTIAVQRSGITVNYFNSLIRELTRRGYLNRLLDVLPDDDDLVDRASKGEGLVRPELAMLLAGVKMWIKDTLLASDLLSDPLLEPFLINYFPKYLHETLGQELTSHPLRENIIATEVTNSLVDATGISFVHRICNGYGVAPSTVIKCALAAEILLSSAELRQAVRQIDTPESGNDYLDFRKEIADATRQVSQWLVGVHGPHLSLRALVALYREAFVSLASQPLECVGVMSLQELDVRRNHITKFDFDALTTNRLAVLPLVRQVLELSWCQHRSHIELGVVARLRDLIANRLAIKELLIRIKKIAGRSKWEQQGTAIAAHEIERTLSAMVVEFLAKGIVRDEDAQAYLASIQGYDELNSAIQELLHGEASPIAALVLAKRIRRFADDIL